ncbi:hypothetical protein Xoosp13_126 [Xanthomonas phage Xoo-sp13]|nr:hypothetical protein Xoosp13_126 [Xanthomonas phage Xoo-sp13]
MGEDKSEYLIKVNQRPEIKEGFIVIGKDMFVTPKPMTTCRAIRASEFDAQVAESKRQKIH